MEQKEEKGRQKAGLWAGADTINNLPFKEYMRFLLFIISNTKEEERFFL